MCIEDNGRRGARRQMWRSAEVDMEARDTAKVDAHQFFLHYKGIFFWQLIDDTMILFWLYSLFMSDLIKSKQRFYCL